MSDEVESTPVEEVKEQNMVEEPEAAAQLEEEAPEISQVKMENFDEEKPAGATGDRLDLIMDIVLPVSIELGRTKMLVKQILELERGSIIELDKMAGEPVDLFINNKKMAEGEVVVVDKHFGVRITSLTDPKNRIKGLGKDN